MLDSHWVRCTKHGWSRERQLWVANFNKVAATQHGSFHSVLLSPKVSLLSLQETSILLSNTSLSPFPAFINCLCWHTDCLHLISQLLVSHLVRFWAFQSQTWWQRAPIQTVSWQPRVMVHPFLFLPECRNFLWGLDNFPCSGELTFYARE